MTKPPTISKEPESPAPRASILRAFCWLTSILLCTAHAAAILAGMGGWAGLTSDGPLYRHDHPLYFHSAVVTRSFLRQSGTTAGYDPAFMAGYPKSVVFPASSTLPELVLALTPGVDPIRTYKAYVFVAAAILPVLVCAAMAAARLGTSAYPVVLVLFLTYLWTDFPINYATFGMLPYLVDIPLALLATALLVQYFRCGGWLRWLAALCGLTLAPLVHLTSVMIVGPAAALALLTALVTNQEESGRFPPRRIGATLLLPVIAVALNAFWWWPGVVLASTKGPSDFAFAHPESIYGRLSKVVNGGEPPIELLLIVLGVPGLFAIWRRDRIAAAGLAGFMAAGFFWGYLAGAFRSLDFLQPGRHTYAFYTAAAVAGGVTVRDSVAAAWGRSRLGALFLIVLAFGTFAWIFGPPLYASLKFHLDPRDPFLSSRSPRRLGWIVDRVKRHVPRGGRLLYEESGFGIPGLADPYNGGRFSGLLPYYTGAELLGGPYLHAALTTNFTQFGEGKLFEKAGWGRDHFVRYAKLYRPDAILCWTPHARRFCQENRDLIEIVDQDGPLLLGRVIGFGGPTVEGKATVEASPGRLHVRFDPAELDRRIILRYHSVPSLRSRPPARLEAVRLEGDPVPFIGLRPPPGATTLELGVVP